MEVECQRRELIALQERIKEAEYSDDLPIHIWARAAKVLDKVADDRKELLRRAVKGKYLSHTKDCWITKVQDEVCNCGFDELIASVEEEIDE